jgi:predicted nucleic acid-binding protein
MANNFFDTSALGKHYHPEAGTARVNQLLQEPASRHFVSRLSVLEIHSVFAGKVRTGVINSADFQLLRRRFLADLTKRKFELVRMTGQHYQDAERLIQQYAPVQSLRTLDALQLAVALDMRRRVGVDRFVCADRRLLAVAAAEGLTVVDPEQP